MTYKFNKTNLLEHMHAERAALEKEWGFNPDNGYNQVVGSDMHRIMAYGRYVQLEDLICDVSYQNIKEAA